MEKEKGEMRIEFSENQKELFKTYKMDKRQISLFVKLRLKSRNSPLTDFHLILIIFSKKTYEKCSKLCENFAKILKKYGMDKKIDLNQKLIDTNEHVRKIFKLPMCYWFANSRTKEGDYGVFYMDYGEWIPTKSDEERKCIVQVFLQMFEHFMKQNVKNVTEGICFFMDFRKFGWNNFDLHIEKMFGEVYRYFPCRLKSAVIFNAPWYISLVVNLLKPFMSGKMVNRLKILKQKEAIDLVGMEQFPSSIGGNMKFDSSDYITLMNSYFALDLNHEKRGERKEEEEEQEHEEKIQVEIIGIEEDGETNEKIEVNLIVPENIN